MAKKRAKWKIILLVAIVATVILMLIPIRLGIKDGGTVVWCPVSFLYRVTKYHRIVDGAEIDGVKYYCSAGTTRYLVGTEVRLLSLFTVYDDTHLESAGEQPYSEEVTDIISYCKANCPDGVELKHVYLDFLNSDEEKIRGIELGFEGNNTLSESNEVFLMMRDYLGDTDGFLYKEGFTVTIHYGVNEKVDKHTWTVTEANYIVKATDLTDIELEISTNMIPAKAPDDLVDVNRIKITSGNLTEEETAILGEMYPGAKIEDPK